ncbi:hypothetical protein, partial [uncultured Mucilaginibacter sp.]|uniref:hypothetical protein n=1 Tax=uncultured Mucilaginibacter sp. TaxID=797541 RepID=UPI0025CBF790
GLYKRLPCSNLHLYEPRTRGTIGGEGAAFFLLSDKSSEKNLAELLAIRTIYKPGSPENLEKKVRLFLAENNLAITDIDLVITGKSGDTAHDDIYERLNLTIFKTINLVNYKHLCGEYPTASAFALWLAVNIIKHRMVPEVVVEKSVLNTMPKKILIYNHYQKIYHSLMLVSAI